MELLGTDLVEFKKDKFGRAVYLRDHLGVITEWEYYEDGYLCHSKNSDTGYESWYRYDSLGRIVSFRDSEGVESVWEYTGHEITVRTNTQNFSNWVCLE